MKNVIKFFRLLFNYNNEFDEISWRLQCQKYLLPMNKFTYDAINDLI